MALAFALALALVFAFSGGLGLGCGLSPAASTATGGRLVAPMFSKIMSSSLRVLDIPPDDLPSKRAAARLKVGGS